MSSSKLRFLAGLATCLLALLLVAPSAGAKIAFLKGWWPGGTSIWVANNDGSSAKQVYKASPSRAIAWVHISPDGKLLNFYELAPYSTTLPWLKVVPSTGGKAKVLARHALGVWSPDSRKIAAVLRGGKGSRLVLIDVATGKTRGLATARHLEIPSFSPRSDRLAYAAGPRESNDADIYTVSVNGGPAKRLTQGLHSTSPVWGPQWIAFSRWHSVGTEGGQIEELYLMRPSGKQLHRLTNAGQNTVFALDWSADGRRLLAQVIGVGAATVDPVSGKVKIVGKPSSSNGPYGVYATALSCDGRTILGTMRVGPIEDQVNVVTLPYQGGKPHALARNASFPDWNR